MDNIAPTYALFLLQEFESRGQQRELLENTQLSIDALQSGANIPLEGFERLLLNAETLSPDTPVGLIIGRRAHALTLGPIGIAAATAPCIREGLQALEAFNRLHATYSNIKLSNSVKGMRVTINFSDQIPETERFHTESVFFMLQNYIEMVIGQPLTEARFNARHTKPDYYRAYERELHSPTTYNNEHISIDIPRTHLDKHSPFYNFDTWKQTLRTLSDRLKELGDVESNSYSQYVLGLLRSYDPPLPSIGFAAERLHMSERTLNRRLHNESTSFRELKSQVLQHWAEQYLTETHLSIDAISALLGYQDAANFRRAFRKQLHCSPGAFRERATHSSS